MAQQKPPTPQQIGRAGELFVAAELNRRGALATLYLTNTPRVDVVASSFDGDRTVNIQVKTKGPRSASWQWNINKAEKEQQTASDRDFIVFVDLAPDQPAYYILKLREVAERRLAGHNEWLERHGGKRPRNQKSTHTAVPLAEVEAGKDAWDILGVTLNAEVGGRKGAGGK